MITLSFPVGRQAGGYRKNEERKTKTKWKSIAMYLWLRVFLNNVHTGRSCVCNWWQGRKPMRRPLAFVVQNGGREVETTVRSFCCVRQVS